MKVEKTPEGRPVGEGARDSRGFPWRLPTTSRASGRLSLNKGGSQGRARCAQVRPWRPSQDGQRPRTPCSPAPDAGIPRFAKPKPLSPRLLTAPDHPESHVPRTPATPCRTHRMEVCGATAGTASSNRCMQRTVVRKHRQRLGQPAPGFEATTAIVPQAKQSTSA